MELHGVAQAILVLCGTAALGLLIGNVLLDFGHNVIGLVQVLLLLIQPGQFTLIPAFQMFIACLLTGLGGRRS